MCVVGFEALQSCWHYLHDLVGVEAIHLPPLVRDFEHPGEAWVDKVKKSIPSIRCRLRVYREIEEVEGA